MRQSIIAAFVCLAMAAGCADRNRELSSSYVRLEDRTLNQTRAATFARLLPAALPEAPLAQQAEILPPHAPPATLPATVATTAPASAPSAASRPPFPADADGCFVGLALSGGGSRSANFGAACMFQLERVGLLQRVDYISSVSGGSLPAAYYCLCDADWNPGHVQQALSHSFASDVIKETLLPWSWPALLLTDYDRTDMLAASFRRNLFSRDGRALTYRDLRPDRPRLLINATDLQSGRRFIFCNESFDAINSDLSAYPIAYAVAASSAVPVLMHPVTLRDYSTRFEQYRHLIDGGVVDNLGIDTLVETFAARVDAARQQKWPDPYPKGAIFIVVDAHTEYDQALSSKRNIGLIENLKMSASLSSSALVNRASSATLADLIVRRAPADETAAQIRQQIDDLARNGYLALDDKSGHRVRVIYLSLSQLKGLTDLPFQGFVESVNGIATYFNIKTLEAYHLYQAADLLIHGKFEPRLAELLQDLDRPVAPSPEP